jgi:uncharacterized membrane protein
MNQYPEVVAAIVNDYLERLKGKLMLIPALERDEFLREIQSHIYEAYNQSPCNDDTQRILAVLRNLGDPAEVVADRLPAAMMRSGSSRNVPLYIVGGILLVLFGIPLGFGGFGILLGLMGALAGLLIAYYAVAGSLLVSGGVIMLLGLTRFLLPEFWERHGSLQIDAPIGAFLDSLPPSDAGLLLMLFAVVFLAAGWGLLRLGKHLLRGLRFLFSLTFDWIRSFAQGVRRKLRPVDSQGPHMVTAQV